MNKVFAVGSKVTLNKSMQRSCVNPDKYRTGVVTQVHSWNIYGVQFSGIDHPISIRGDELINL